MCIILDDDLAWQIRFATKCNHQRLLGVEWVGVEESEMAKMNLRLLFMAPIRVQANSINKVYPHSFTFC